MDYGICHLSVIPLRKENSDESEMVSQLLYGDCFKTLKKRKNWLYISCLTDSYNGWIDIKQAVEISFEQVQKISDDQSKFTLDLIHYMHGSNNQMFPIILGSNVAGAALLHHEYDGEFTAKKKPKSDLIKLASLYLNAPYLWGGKTPFGIDCSGFTQMVYRINGIALPRDAYQQATIGTTLSFIEESEPGDLAFFDNKEGNIIHVGILLENNYIIHAHGCVRIDRIDQTGIYNLERNQHSHRLRLIKKII